MTTVTDYSKGVDECWFDSSAILYSRFVENPNDNNGQLYVTFKGGSTYWYKNVSMPFNYLQFKHGMKDNSSGKSLNEYIKPFYEYEKVENVSLEEIERRRIEAVSRQDISDTYFISGHRDLTRTEFDTYYASILLDMKDDSTAKYVVGDCEGADIMAQDYLIDIMGISPDRITVYCVDNSPRFINPAITNIKGDFADDIEKDSEMTRRSHYDIAFIRRGKETSGTAQNILRRYYMA